MSNGLPASLCCVLAAVAVPALVVLIWWIAVYNRFVKLRQQLRESWADIDVELKRRHDLIPNLVETVKGYAAHEREVLESVTAARNAAVAQPDTPAAMGRDETRLQHEVGRLFAVAEGYPQLKADTNFRQLQEELALTEDRLAAARRFYNGNVRDLNALVEQFPTKLVAGAGGFRTAEYFEVADDAERAVPRVTL